MCFIFKTASGSKRKVSGYTHTEPWADAPPLKKVPGNQLVLYVPPKEPKIDIDDPTRFESNPSHSSGRLPDDYVPDYYEPPRQYSSRPPGAHLPAKPRKRMYGRRRSYRRRTYGRRSYGRRYGSYYRRRPYYRGRGAYYLHANGAMSGGIPGIGKFAVGARGGLVSGLGAYELGNISHNTLIKPDIPEIRNAAYVEGATIIRHREYLGPITTSATAGAFKIENFELNPAQSAAFPWLSQIAENYEEYKPNGLLFEFRSTASDAIASSTNLALGQVMMATQYDPTDPPFTNDVDMLNYSWAQSGKVSDNLQHFVECDPKQSPMSHLYTRAGTEASSSDLRFSDFGRFSIATQGLQGTNVQIGQLWVSYEFLLYKPKIGESQSTGGGIFMLQQADGSVSTNKIVGDIGNAELYEGNNIPMALSYDDNGYFRVVFPQRNVECTYDVSFTVIGDGSALVGVNADPVTTQQGTNIKYIKLFNENSQGFVKSPTAAAINASRWLLRYIVNVDASENNSQNHIIFRTNLATIANNSDACFIVQQMSTIDPSYYGFTTTT